MSDPWNEGLLSARAEWHLASWRSGFCDDLLQRFDLEVIYLAHSQEIQRWVNRTEEVDAALKQAINATANFCGRDHLQPDPRRFERLKAAGLSALDELERACRDAGLSAEARALGA